MAAAGSCSYWRATVATTSAAYLVRLRTYKMNFTVVHRSNDSLLLFSDFLGYDHDNLKCFEESNLINIHTQV